MKLVALCLLAFVAYASARPRFIAIPIEDVEFVDVNGQPVQGYPVQGHRMRRAAFPDKEVPHNNNKDSAYAASGHNYSGNDYVDYGAYTGGNGALDGILTTQLEAATTKVFD